MMPGGVWEDHGRHCFAYRGTLKNEPDKLSPIAAEQIEKAPRGLEPALLAHEGRIVFEIEPRTWFEKALRRAPDCDLNLLGSVRTILTRIGLSPPVALEAYRLPDKFHDDPGDRFIAATVHILKASLVTKDQQIWAYPRVTTLWD